MAADGEEAPNSAPPSPPTPVQLPPYPEMILEAIDELNNENGSNKTAISGYMKRKYSSSLPPLHTKILTAHLARMRTTGELHFEKNNYFRTDDNKEEEDPSEPADANDEDVPTPIHVSGEEEEDPIPSEPADANDEDVPTSAHVAAEAEEPGAASTAVPVVADCSDGVPAPTPTAAVAPGAGAATLKRGRGRPPKPKASVAEATVDAAAAQVIASDAGAAPVKRGRGRPPKPKAPVAEATVDAAAEPVIANDTIDAAADPVVSNDTRGVPMKRGRGRPPKPKDPVAEAVSVATRGMPRARGRPPKKAKVAKETPIGSSASSNSNADGANVVPVKRGRGRPPKVRP